MRALIGDKDDYAIVFLIFGQKYYGVSIDDSAMLCYYCC